MPRTPEEREVALECLRAAIQADAHRALELAKVFYEFVAGKPD